MAGKAKEETSQGRTWKNVMVHLQQHEDVFICLEKKDTLVTKNLVPRESVYEEQRIFQKEMTKFSTKPVTPLDSELAAATLGDVNQVHSKRNVGGPRCSTLGQSRVLLTSTSVISSAWRI